MNEEPKVVVVTGAGGGIGRALAVGFARDGAAVVAFGRDAGSLAETARSAPEGRVRCVAGNVASEADVERLVDEAESAHGRIDVLINNAAVYPKATLIDHPLGEWLGTLETNVAGPLLCYRKVLPGMLARGYGRIINMGSFAGRAPLPGSSAYSVSKAALGSLNKAMAAEIDRSKYPNVLVNELNPGAVKTRMSESGDDPDRVYPYVLAMIDLPSGGPTGRIFSKGVLFDEHAGIKTRLKRKIRALLGGKDH